jgi:polyphosphate kinase
MIFKVNSLGDPQIIRTLYKASREGVRIQLLVRGICCLRPGLPGVSEKIEVTSVVGRFLEHSRIYYFNNGGEDDMYIGSADLMPRNIDHRVEVLVPILDRGLVRSLREDVLAVYLSDNVKARYMLPSGAYTRKKAGSGPKVNSQEYLLRKRPGSKNQKHARIKLRP